MRPTPHSPGQSGHPKFHFTAISMDQLWAEVLLFICRRRAHTLRSAVGDQGCNTAPGFVSAVMPPSDLPGLSYSCLNKTVTLPAHRKVYGDTFCSGAIASASLSRQDCDAALRLVTQQEYFASLTASRDVIGFLIVPSVTISFSVSDVFLWNALSWFVNKHLLFDYILPDHLRRTCRLFTSHKECRMSKSRWMIEPKIFLCALHTYVFCELYAWGLA